MTCLKVCLESCALVACLIFLSAVSSPAQAQTEPASATLTKRLIADYGYWSRTQVPPYSADQIPFKKLTHINHAPESASTLTAISMFLPVFSSGSVLNKGQERCQR